MNAYNIKQLRGAWGAGYHAALSKTQEKPQVETPCAESEVSFKGVRFENRLKSTWASFLDDIGVEWAYKKEGFFLGENGWIFPDFALSSGDFVQVMPVCPDDEYIAKAVSLSQKFDVDVVIFVGHPCPESLVIYLCLAGESFGRLGKCWGGNDLCLSACCKCGGIAFALRTGNRGSLEGIRPIAQLTQKEKGCECCYHWLRKTDCEPSFKPFPKLVSLRNAFHAAKSFKISQEVKPNV